MKLIPNTTQQELFSIVDLISALAFKDHLPALRVKASKQTGRICDSGVAIINGTNRFNSCGTIVRIEVRPQIASQSPFSANVSNSHHDHLFLLLSQ